MHCTLLSSAHLLELLQLQPDPVNGVELVGALLSLLRLPFTDDDLLSPSVSALTGLAISIPAFGPVHRYPAEMW